MKFIRSHQKIIAIALTMVMFNTFAPYELLASNNGPNAPEAANFEPVSATDMVNLSSGDMAYVLPLLEIDGFPVSLSYHAGIPMDMESSWAGLGWNINTGSIARGVVATPDDWNNGRRLNLTFLKGSTETYTVDVGVGIKTAAEVGVGLSWGPNKAMSGSVSAGVGPASISVDTEGGVGVSLNPFKLGSFKGAFSDIGTMKSKSLPYGGSLSYSNKGGFSASASVKGSSAKGLNSGMGISVSGQGVGASLSVGYGKNMNTTKAEGAGGSMNMSSFSAGDFSYNTKGFYIPLTIGVLSFGFGYQKTDIQVDVANNKHAFGNLYHNNLSLYSDTQWGNPLGEAKPDQVFRDYQRRSYFGDVYEQVIPQQEADFIADYRKQVEKLNFTFPGYDSYSINATGIGGSLRPVIGQNHALMAEGFDGNSTHFTNKKAKVFYHNSAGSLRSTRSVVNNGMHFVFDGQITEDALMGNVSISDATGNSNLSLGNYINRGTSINGRPRSGSFVEVFTNQQIDQGAPILHPSASYQNGNLRLRSSLGYQSQGIGAYRITAADGKTYHFSQPVYQYEQIQHNYMNFDDASNLDPHNSQSKREATPYATHWLLTAITGPDYIDDGNDFPDEGDLGYWVRLDHGQWSSAYAWRSPHDDRLLTDPGAKRHYSTYVDNEVEESDPGYFIQGRKDLYYLDKIVSKEQVAYFVKDIRYDGLGTEADYIYRPQGQVRFDDKLIAGDEDTYAWENIKYEKEYQLKLDKIVITKNENQVSNNLFQGSFRGLTPDVLNGRYLTQGIVYQELGPVASQHKLHQARNILDVDDFQGFDYSRASKVIKFNTDYSLAPQTPSSKHGNNPTAGRLTLNSVKFYGRGTDANADLYADESELFDYMPPYQFEYKNPGYIHETDTINEVTIPIGFGLTRKYYEFKRANKDNWGFRNAVINGENSIDAWSLNKIKTPQGSSIELEYDEDDFKIEAFSRKFWRDHLQFDINKYVVNGVDHFDIIIENEANFAYPVDFNDYFRVGEKVFFDFWLAVKRQTKITNTRDKVGKVDITTDKNVVVKAIQGTNRLILTVSGNDINDCSGILNCVPDLPINPPSAQPFDKNDQGTSRGWEDGPRGSHPSDVRRWETAHRMTYTLLANKVAPGTSGGGLRVKSITVRDEANNRYVTEYDYNDPHTGRTSGITSFDPTYGEVYVPYQNELPGPGVMYEWVTMKSYGYQGNNKILDTQKRYHYYTLQPVYDIFNPNIDMKDIDGETIFKTWVEDESMSQEKLTAKKMNIEKNLTKIGQLISVEELNAYGHVLAKSVNRYRPRLGELRENFSSMKSVFDFDLDGNDIANHAAGQLYQRYLALSSKSEKVSVVDSIYTFGAAGNSWIAYSNEDPYLGTFTTSVKEMADGTIVREEKIPAYRFYNDMGSKALNSSNKNMLTQEAMNVASVKIGNNWKTTNASITTWNDDWTYRSETGVETTPTASDEKIWRKHKNYVWKENIDPVNGTYLTNVTEANDYFNWITGQPTTSKWQEISEITRYNHYSVPLETKDINGNFASSKMVDNWSKTSISGNARYTEMYYSGAEHLFNGNLEGEIMGVNNRSTASAHTGKYSLDITNAYSQAFRVTGTVGSSHADHSKKFRPGKYKVSVWADRNTKVDQEIKLVFNGSTIPESSRVNAGQWIQLNYIVNLQPNSSATLYFTNNSYTGNGHLYLDDFRMHPIYTAVNTYVYDEQTDALIAILDGNNLATKFKYDQAGRLIQTYKEAASSSPEGFQGGFKMVQEFDYHYKTQ